MTRPEMPESTKMLKVADTSQAIGSFLDWLSSQKIYLVHTVHDAENDREIELSGPGCSYERLLARYFQIDLDKVELEKRELLKWIAANQEVPA